MALKDFYTEALKDYYTETVNQGFGQLTYQGKPFTVGIRRNPSPLQLNEESMDITKVLTALCDRLGLTIDHKSELVETRPGKAWGGDSFTPTNFAKVREDLDDVQEIVMGLARYLEVEVTVEDGRKVTVTPPKEEAGEPENDRTGDDPF
jgi:hypothetical protein